MRTKQCFLLAILATCFVSAAAEAEECTNVLSVPATQIEVECRTNAEKEAGRCGGGVAHAVCVVLTNASYDAGLITLAAKNWLFAQEPMQCAMYTAYDGVPPFVMGICPEGCFEANTEFFMLSKEGVVGSKSARDITKSDEIASLTSTSSLVEPEFASRSIHNITSGPEELELYVFSLENDRSLAVTTFHPMVLADGRIIRAKDVNAGDEFVGIDGEIVVVENVSLRHTEEDVYNFWVDVDSSQEHVIVAEDVLVGDLGLQAISDAEMESIRLRR